MDFIKLFNEEKYKEIIEYKHKPIDHCEYKHICSLSLIKLGEKNENTLLIEDGKKHINELLEYKKCNIDRNGLIHNYKYACSLLALIFEKKEGPKKALKYILDIMKYDKSDSTNYYNLGVLYNKLGNNDISIRNLEKALSYCKNNDQIIKITKELVIVFKNNGNYDCCIAHINNIINNYKDSIPEYFELMNIYGILLMTTNNFKKAEEVFENIIKENCNISIETYLNYGCCFSMQGKINKSMEMYKKVLNNKEEIKNRYTSLAFSNMCLNMNYSNLHLLEYYNFVKTYNKYMEKRSEIMIRTRYIPSNKIRIGYISGDFTNHACTSLFNQFFTHFSNERFEVYRFSTKNIKQIDDSLINIEHLSLDVICDLIVNKYNIDVLVDLSGHTMGNRLDVFESIDSKIKTITYMGFPNSTGLLSMNYKIVDTITEKNIITKYTEKLIKFNGCMICYNPYIRLNRSTLPEITYNIKEYIILGVFNKLNKINTDMLLTWKKLMRKIKDKNVILLIKSRIKLDEKMMKEIMEEQYENISYIPYTDHTEYLNDFNKVDLILDTYPYSGTTITCDSLSMGTPIITIRGEHHVSNVCSSIIYHSLFDPELYISSNFEEYIDKTINIINNGINKYEIRRQFLSSRVCNPSIFMEEYETFISNLF